MSKENKKNRAIFHFNGWPNIGRTGLCVGSYDNNGHTRGYITLYDSGVEVYMRGKKEPTRSLSWQEVMLKLLAVVMIAVTLSSCAESETAQAITDTRNLPANYGAVALATVKAHLKDPASVTTLRLSETPMASGNGMTGVFVDVNAKNSFGGYTGIQPVLVEFKDRQVVGIIQ
jgi:hypothetical protein